MLQTRTINAPRAAKAIVGAIDGTANFREEFTSALLNHDNDTSLSDVYNSLTPPKERRKGISICYGETEGLSAIVRAFRNLQQLSAKEEFGMSVALALQKYAECFPENREGGGYAHFLLHGLAQPSLEEVIQKLSENAQILIESNASRNELIAQQPPKCRLPGFHFEIERGPADDRDGVAFELCSNKDEIGGASQYRLAHIGFLLSPSRSQAIVITVQGRKIYYRKPLQPTSDSPTEQKEYEEKLRNYRQCAEQGRNFARAAAYLGVDPRAYTLSCVIERLFQQGYKEIKGIVPSEHVMCIGNHKGFSAHYEKIFSQAGMSKVDNLYYSIAKNA